MTYVHAGRERYPIPVRVELPVADKADLGRRARARSRARTSGASRAAVRSWSRVHEHAWDGAIYHKDLLPVAYVTGDMAGRLDSPLYGMFSMVGRICA